MTVERSRLHACECAFGPHGKASDGTPVVDRRLQAIADAYQATLDEAPYLNTGGVPRLLRTEAPELTDLLDALAEEEL